MLVVPGGVRVFEELLPFSTSETALMLLAYLPMGFATFFYYAVDKWRAVQNERQRQQGRKETHWRVPERQLHLMEFFGGWPGALLAQYALRHKSRKESFQVDFWLVGFFHIALVGSALFLQDSWLGTGLVLLLGFIAWSKACQ
ncbi:DUF1294 domain-containing protein [Meiothermus sp. QL-1]|nr:DUF1294 domain-containing protein [Meiothermus sp. QL-1]